MLLVGCGESQSPELPTAEAPHYPLWKAVENGNIEAVKQHLDAGTDVNAKDNFGFIPLHLAARRGHKEIAELLIASGAHVNAKRYMSAKYTDGTPLDWAIIGKHSETANLLRKHGGKTGEELKAAGN
ncbi:MAG: ankyrin repeat domain-containing protein [Pirellulales bacterium]